MQDLKDNKIIQFLVNGFAGKEKTTQVYLDLMMIEDSNEKTKLTASKVMEIHFKLSVVLKSLANVKQTDLKGIA